jgi:O-antigen ligase
MQSRAFLPPAAPQSIFIPALLAIVVSAIQIISGKPCVAFVSVLCVCFLFADHFRVSFNLLRLIIMPVALLIWGIVLGVFEENDWTAYLRDGYQVGKLTVLLAVGYYLGSRMSAELLWRTLVRVTVCCAIFYLLFVYLTVGPGMSVVDLRLTSDLHRGILIIGPVLGPLVAHLVRSRNALNTVGWAIFNFIILLVALLVSQSRSTLVASAICSLVFLWYLANVPKTLLAVAAISLATLVVLVTELRVLDSDTGTVVDRFKGSLSEVTTGDFLNERDVNQNWRAYEAHLAIMEWENASLFNKICGFGFGKEIDLGIRIKLLEDEDAYESIGYLHNGYMYILLKFGVAGIIAYGLFLAWMCKLGWEAISVPARRLAGTSLLACSLMVVFTTLVVGGLFHSGRLMGDPILIGAFYALTTNGARNQA